MLGSKSMGKGKSKVEPMSCILLSEALHDETEGISSGVCAEGGESSECSVIVWRRSSRVLGSSKEKPASGACLLRSSALWKDGEGELADELLEESGGVAMASMFGEDVVVVNEEQAAT